MTETTLSLQQDFAYVFGVKIPLLITSSGYYLILITKGEQVITKHWSPTKPHVTLTITDTVSEQQLALKHHPFALPG